MSQTAIQVDNISKLYHLGKKASGSLRETISNAVTQRFSRKNSDQPDETEFWALKDVSFTVNQGDVVGIIGKNGAGKSTLLKILSRITEPTTGRIQINGRVGSLLEVGTGFHPELSGRENIFLNGSILGMRRSEIQAKFDEIVEFSGIEKFIDTPVKRYSSGMYVRLAFSVAAHLEPEVLIIDEVLAVGDAEFQKKCLGKMQDVAGHGRTVLFVSHNMTAVRNLCKTGVLLNQGTIANIGPISDVISHYESIYIPQENKLQFCNPNLDESHSRILSASILIDNSELPTVDNSKIDCFSKLKLTMEFQSQEKRTGVSVGYYLYRNDEHLFTSFDGDSDQSRLLKQRIGKYYIDVDLPFPLKAGKYHMDLLLGFPNGSTSEQHIAALTFIVEELSFDPTFIGMAEKRRGVVPILNPWNQKQIS